MPHLSPSIAFHCCLALCGAGCTTSGGGGGGATPGSGGASGAGSGGNVGAGGSAAGSGGAGSGGAAGAGAGGAGMTVTCTFTASSTTSSRIPTVGIVTWSTTLPNVQEAHIDFGLTTAYGMTAPVNMAATSYRTLLLGMKASRMYHYRISASGGGSQCASQDFTIMTGARANGLPTITVTNGTGGSRFGGFLITGQYVRNAGPSGAPAYIVDADGEIVWWFNIGSDVTGARLTYDGQHMWINKGNVPEGMANVHRVSMDGLTDENLTTQFTGLSHQLAVLPDETVAFYAYGSNDCEDVKERAPNGTVKTIANVRTATGTSGMCHANTIQYSASDDTLVFSDLDHDNYAKVTRTGATVWVLGGSTSDFTGEGASWVGGQHGLDILGMDRFLIFNNNDTGGGSASSIAIEILLNLSSMTATRAWSYTPNPPIANAIMGDVQRLDNGNTIVAYSTQGVLHEVSASGALVQEWSWPLGASFGYIEKRATLYGPPPK